MVGQIENSENHFTITEGFKESTADPNNMENATNGVGTGGEIAHDASHEPRVETVRGPERASPEVVLGHEFSHAVDFDNGTHVKDESDVTGNKRGEDLAIIRENKIRREMGLPRRMRWD